VTAVTAAPDGRLAVNILHFSRLLRAAGLPVGPAQVMRAVEAAEAVGVHRRTDFYWALHAVLVGRRDQHELFDQAFHLFWRNPRLLEQAMGVLLPSMKPELAPDAGEPVLRRLAEAFQQHRPQAPQAEPPPQIEVDATLTWSAREALQGKDFEAMTAAETEQARALLRRIALPLPELPTRRTRPDPAGRRIDLRATLRRSVRAGGDLLELERRAPRRRPPPLVVLCDISGSMDRYARMMLQFLHAVTSDRDRVHSFLFGTRLTNITRQLRTRDVDLALGRVGQAVQDWSGGTRIGACLHEFNRVWSRRVLGQGAVVLLITDGLDRDAGDGLGAEMDRLHRSCRRLVWLNPLLRWDGFSPRSSGIRAMLPHVDEFRPVHNLNSLAQLVEALRALPSHRRGGVDKRWGLSA
jgi:uncharacterized protein with von Willebrand factor type A (vWA) domain